MRVCKEPADHSLGRLCIPDHAENGTGTCQSLSTRSKHCAFFRRYSGSTLSDVARLVNLLGFPYFLRQNKTYNIVWWLEERYTPKSIPAGDYRLDIQFFAHDNVKLFALETYITVRRAGVIASMIEW